MMTKYVIKAAANTYMVTAGGGAYHFSPSVEEARKFDYMTEAVLFMENHFLEHVQWSLGLKVVPA